MIVDDGPRLRWRQPAAVACVCLAVLLSYVIIVLAWAR